MSKQVIIQEPKFLCATDVASILQVSESTAYRLIRTLNQELKSKGYITVSGKISRRYFEEKVCM